MDRRTLLKTGALSAATAWLPLGRLAASEGASHSAQQPPAGKFVFRLIMTGSFVVVFDNDGSKAQVSLLLPRKEPGGCEVPLHEPHLMLRQGKATDKRDSWDAAGIMFAPKVKAKFTATDYNTIATEGEHPTPATGWRSLKWLRMLPGNYNEPKLLERRSSAVDLTGGALHGYVPDFDVAYYTMWSLRDKKGNPGSPARQALTDRILFEAMIEGSEIEVGRRVLGNDRDVSPITLSPDGGGGVELELHNRITSNKETYNADTVLTHFCGGYQIVDQTLAPEARFLPKADGKFPPVETEGPGFLAFSPKSDPPTGVGGMGNPYPLCDGYRVIKPKTKA